MIGRAEIERSLTGAWRLFLNKPDALSYFDTSLEGFWRSFQAIVLVAPIYVLTALADRTGAFSQAIADGKVDSAAFWTTQAVTVVVDWFALPVLLAGIAGMIGIKRLYPTYITLRNWAAPLMVLPFAALSLLDRFGINQDALRLLAIAALAFTLRFGFLIARRTLGVGIDIAIGLVVLDVLVSFGVVTIIGRLTGIELVD